MITRSTQSPTNEQRLSDWRGIYDAFGAQLYESQGEPSSTHSSPNRPEAHLLPKGINSFSGRTGPPVEETGHDFNAGVCRLFGRLSMKGSRPRKQASAPLATAIKVLAEIGGGLIMAAVGSGFLIYAIWIAEGLK